MRNVGGHTRVRTAKRRTAQSTRWLERQLNDPYVKRAKAEGYRSRAAYKLIELDEKFGFLKGSKRVVDLGIAPGGWAQVVRRVVPKAAVAGIDLLPVDPIDGVTIFQHDFLADDAPAMLSEALDGPPDLVLSDMAANTVGHPQTDALRTMALVEAAAVGCPALASRVGGIPEVVIDGQSGRLLPTEDAQALAEALAQVLADPGCLTRWGAAARSRYRERFTVEAMCAGVLDSYRAAVGQEGR